MNESNLFRLTVKAVILPRDLGLRSLMREYKVYKKVFLPRVKETLKPAIKDANIEVYSIQKHLLGKKLMEYLKNLPFHPMAFGNQSYWIEEKDKNFWIHIATKKGEAICFLKIPSKYRNLIKMACGKTCPHKTEEKACEFAYCPFNTQKMCEKINPYEPKAWIGVDVGWNKLATSIACVCNPHIHFFNPTFHGKEFKTRIIQLKHLLKEYARKGKAWKKWDCRLKYTIKYAVGVVAKEIVLKAKKLKACVVMEQLTFKSVTKGYLVPRYKLMIAVKTLCEREGVPFKLVPAQYTSITCPKCGYQDKNNRNREWFKCLKCGYQTDADLVGAMNIAKKGLTATQMEGRLI